MSKKVIQTDSGFKILDERKPTVFDKITESVETPAEKLVFNYYFEDCHYQTRAWKSLFFLHNRYKTKAEAIAATIEELKKEWKK